VPSFPALAAALNTSNAQIQLSFSYYLLFYGLSQFVYGPYSEKHGRKKIALFGHCLSLIGTIFCIFATNIHIFHAGRVIQGIGLGAGPVLYRAILRDTFKGDRLSRIASIVAIGKACITAIAPTIGGYIQKFLGWHYTFVFLFVYTLAGILLISIFFPETLSKPDPKATNVRIILKTFYRILKHSSFLSYALCGSIAFAGIAVYLTISPFLFQNVLGISPVKYGWLALIISGSIVIGGFINYSLVKKAGWRRMLKFAVVVMAFAGILMMSLGIEYLNIVVIIIPMSIYIIGAGIAVGNCNVGGMHSFAETAGFAGALYGVIQVLGGAAATSISSLVHERTQIPLSLTLISFSLACLMLQWLGRQKKNIGKIRRINIAK
jgi:DHA1 family 2-module integral membrane pump EmrD-like MFS transporter